jgi:hypothetical protein
LSIKKSNAPPQLVKLSDIVSGSEPSKTTTFEPVDEGKITQ